MKYLKDFLRISLFVVLVYTPMAWYSFRSLLQDMVQKQIETVSIKLTTTKSEIEKLLVDGRLLEACQRLTALQEARSITTYFIQAPDAECHFAGMNVFPPMESDGVIRTFKINGLLTNLILGQLNGIKWTVGILLPEEKSFVELMQTSQPIREALIKDLLSVIYIICAFIFCAVLILAKSIQNQYRQKGKDPLWLRFINITFGRIQLDDLKIIQSASSALMLQKNALIKDKDLLETSLEHSILNEIKENNHKIPYTFFGTVAKVDINGFSKVISAGDSIQSHNLTKFLEDFGCELLRRYNGLFEKTVGDEIVVVFKSEDSARLAAAFARDLMAEFSKLDFNISDEKRCFTLKGSISSSALTFSKRAPGYGFHGDALTYSSRLLDMVTLKDRNFLSCLNKETQEIKTLILLPTERKKFEFKNMAPTEGYLIDTFLSVEQVYDQNFNELKYFRSNNALKFLLNKVQVEKDFKKIESIFSFLKMIKPSLINSEILTAWLTAIAYFEQKCAAEKNYFVLLAKLIMLGSNLIPQGQWNDASTKVLMSLPKNLDGRINASVVEVLMEKNLPLVIIENKAQFFLKSDESFRTRGNILINQAYHQLDNAVLADVIKMMSSVNAAESSTGVFCACTIILYFQNLNPAELALYSNFQKVITLLSVSKEKNSMLSERLHHLVDQTIVLTKQNSKVA